MSVIPPPTPLCELVQGATVTVMAIVRESPIHKCCSLYHSYFVEIADNTDAVFVAGFESLGAQLMTLKKGQAILLENVLVESNKPQFLNRSPFNHLRLRVTSSTTISEVLVDNPAPSKTNLTVEITGPLSLSENTNQVTLACQNASGAWRVTFYGLFYRQWMKNNDPTRMLLESVIVLENELRLCPESSVRFFNGNRPSSDTSLPTSTVVEKKTSAAVTLHMPHTEAPKEESELKEEFELKEGQAEYESKALQTAPVANTSLVALNSSKKRKRDDADASVDDERTAKRTKSTLVTSTELMDARCPTASPVEVDLAEGRVLWISDRELFDKLLDRTPRAAARPSTTSFWSTLSRVAAVTAVLSVGGLYFLTPEKIVIFMSLANYFKVINPI